MSVFRMQMMKFCSDIFISIGLDRNFEGWPKFNLWAVISHEITLDEIFWRKWDYRKYQDHRINTIWYSLVAIVAMETHRMVHQNWYHTWFHLYLRNPASHLEISVVNKSGYLTCHRQVEFQRHAFHSAFNSCHEGLVDCLDGSLHFIVSTLVTFVTNIYRN